MYKVAIYARLSKEDKGISESIENQIDLVKEFVSKKEDMEVIKIYKDDGYSGSNFDRPDFQMMMTEIRSGDIDCVIVKDFSRLGRNYIESCKYIEKVFPFLGVRFIAINDNYDSENEKSDADEILIPFKNLMNDAYLRDISVKIRSQMEVKRKKGEFIGAFAVYGYQKSKENKNKLEVDTYAASVVREIFNLKIEGYSAQKIAGILNEKGELSPSEYKKMNGIRLSTPFDGMNKAKWSVGSVNRILKNEVYIGTLSQGKVTTPNHKIKKVIKKSKDEWITIENNHESIIEKNTFEFVQELMKIDTRISPGQTKEYPFSGLLFCGDCGYNMIRKTVTNDGKKYFYYVCGKHKMKEGCSQHNTSELTLERAVYHTLSTIFSVYYDDTLEINSSNNGISRLNKSLEIKQQELHKFEQLKLSVFEDYHDDILSKEDFILYTNNYEDKIKEVQEAIKVIEKEIQAEDTTIKAFETKQFELSKKILSSFLSAIQIFDDKSINIIFRFKEEVV